MEHPIYCTSFQKKNCYNCCIKRNCKFIITWKKNNFSKIRTLFPTIEASICNIDNESELAELLRLTNLVIWDDDLMSHKFCFGALDKSLKVIMSETKNSSKKIFGGKVIVFGSDFKHILHIISRGGRVDIIHSTINNLYIWDHCKVLGLTSYKEYLATK